MPPEIPRPGFKSTDSGIGFVLGYDTRDNVFTPGREVNLEAAGTVLVPWPGSDNADQDYTVKGQFYWNVHP